MLFLEIANRQFHQPLPAGLRKTTPPEGGLSQLFSHEIIYIVELTTARVGALTAFP